MGVDFVAAVERNVGLLYEVYLHPYLLLYLLSVTLYLGVYPTLTQHILMSRNVIYISIHHYQSVILDGNPIQLLM